MEHQTQNPIQLLLVMPAEDGAAMIRAALAKHPTISVIPCKATDIPNHALAQHPVDAACLIADGCGSDTAGWIAQLGALDKQLPIIVFAPQEAADVSADLMAETRVTVLSADDVSLPCFPALLRKLINYEHAQRPEMVKRNISATAPALDNARLFQEAQAARKHAEEALLRFQHLDTLKSQFIQNVSHELRTPLAIVRGYIDLTLDGAFGEKMEPVLRQSFQTIQTHIHHLNTLVEAITVLEDAERQRLTLLPQAVLPVLRIALQTTDKRAAQQQVEIIADLPHALPDIKMDTHYIIRALEQVLDNAIKFNRKPGRVSVKAWADEDEVWLRIRDEGIGIPATELPHIFTRFYQVDGTTSRKYGGMGLGLAITKEVVTAHHGRVWADSAGAGCGTTLTITLPIYKPEVDL